MHYFSLNEAKRNSQTRELKDGFEQKLVLAHHFHEAKRNSQIRELKALVLSLSKCSTLLKKQRETPK